MFALEHIRIPETNVAAIGQFSVSNSASFLLRKHEASRASVNLAQDKGRVILGRGRHESSVWRNFFETIFFIDFSEVRLIGQLFRNREVHFAVSDSGRSPSTIFKFVNEIYVSARFATRQNIYSRDQCIRAVPFPDDNPRTFESVSCSDLIPQDDCGNNGKDGDYHSRPSVYSASPVIRYGGGLVCIGLAFFFCWFAVQGVGDTDWRLWAAFAGGSILGVVSLYGAVRLLLWK
jgi:hypothetical protein